MLKFTPELYQELKLKVCKDCYLADDNGNCLINRDQKCVFDLYSTQIIKALEQTWGSSEKDIDIALRTEVCAVCTHKSDSGYCYVRDGSECPLSSLFTVISTAAVGMGHE